MSEQRNPARPAVADESYALITSAYNEGEYIGHTIRSVISQTVRPITWIIVSDGSTDGTDDIVKFHAQKHHFIRYVRINDTHIRIPAAQVHAFNAAYETLKSGNYDFIGNLDADISFGPDYFEKLLCRFRENPRLGLAGGIVETEPGGYRKPLRGEGFRNVCQAVQLFRRSCYEEIGGYPALRYGASDTYMEVKARMLNWEVESYPDLVVRHHRYTGTASGLIRGRLRQGCADFYVGTHPLFEIARCARRWDGKPVILGSMLRLAAFFYLCCTHRVPAVSTDFVNWYRDEQLKRLGAWITRKRTSPLR